MHDILSERVEPWQADDLLGHVPVTSASTLPPDRFRTQPRSPRLAAVRVAQSW
jgi:hypothetical protein